MARLIGQHPRRDLGIGRLRRSHRGLPDAILFVLGAATNHDPLNGFVATDSVDRPTAGASADRRRDCTTRTRASRGRAPARHGDSAHANRIVARSCTGRRHQQRGSHGGVARGAHGARSRRADGSDTAACHQRDRRHPAHQSRPGAAGPGGAGARRRRRVRLLEPRVRHRHRSSWPARCPCRTSDLQSHRRRSGARRQQQRGCDAARARGPGRRPRGHRFAWRAGRDRRRLSHS